MKVIFEVPDALAPVSVVDVIRFLSSHLSPLDMLVPGDVFRICIDAKVDKRNEQKFDRV